MSTEQPIIPENWKEDPVGAIETAISNIDTEAVSDFIIMHGLNLLSAIVIFYIGKWAAKWMVRIIDRGLARAGVEKTLATFLENIAYGAAMVLVAIAALAQMGVETTSFAAAIAAAGLAIGLALQGSLSNFAAGVLIILFKPFRAGDYIEVAGVGGTVEQISIFTTQLATPDNREIIIPNNNITTDTIVNYSAKLKRRIDLTVGVAYNSDLKKSRQIFEKVIAEDDRILKDPAPQIAVMTLGESSVDFVVRPWVKAKDYWDTCFSLNEKIKIELDKAGIGIPFPQRDVNLFIRDGNVQTAPATKKKVTKKTA